MIEIRSLAQVDLADLRRIAPSYTSWHVYDVTREETPERTAITLTLRKLNAPITRPFPRTPDVETYYGEAVARGFSLGVYDTEAGDALIGVVIADAQEWNGTLLVWEFHIAEAYRRRGIGSRMVEALVDVATQAGLRVICAETDNINVPAIAFYRRAGFTIDSLDLSFYSNDDLEKGQIVVFMKRKLAPGQP